LGLQNPVQAIRIAFFMICADAAMIIERLKKHLPEINLPQVAD
jgi:hypothetical protein